MSDRTYILGIESSCDETSCAVVADGGEVLSNIVASQVDLHAKFGGVVPEIASRAHIEAINSVIASAIESASVGMDQFSAVAVANQPGLIGSLLIGLMAAKTLAWVHNLPLIGVNHIYAHAYSPAVDSAPLEYPAVALVASGGHTALYRCDSPIELQLLGATIDDAAGEAFDKVASILGLGYPGGPVIDKIAREANPKAVDFPRSLLKGQSLDFSFSGLKTAVLYHVNGVPGALRKPNQPKVGLENLSDSDIADIAASFQGAVVDVLKIKLRRAAKIVAPKTLILGGGVSANSQLRDAAADLADKLGCKLRLPALKYCQDNAAMIAGVGYHYLKAGLTAGLDLDARATVSR